MNIQMINLNQIKPYKNNPRKNANAVDAVMNSIKEFGFKQPIVIDKNYEIVAGHTRVLAAKKLNLTEIPCIIADDLTEQQIKAFRLADNKTHELAEWDFDLLDIELDDIADLNMGDFGFDISVDFEHQEFKDDDFDVEAAIPDEPITKLGDIWQLGNHRLMCGDGTNADDIDKLMDGHNAQLIVTDPPYNVDYEGKTQQKLKINSDRQTDAAFREFLLAAFKNIYRVSKAGAAVYIFHADSKGLDFRHAFKEAGFDTKQCLIWLKNTFVLGHQDYHWKHEPILYGWKDGSSHYFIDHRTQTTVIEHNRPTKNSEHPTMKPVSLIEQLIHNSSKVGWAVLDIFGGSGSTLIACEQLKRSCYMMELDPRYCDVIVKRWEMFTGNEAIKI